MANPYASVGAGRNRKPWRIREWMDSQGILQMDVARSAGLKSSAVVSRTIRGSANSRRVLKALLEMGCPAVYLGLPEDLKREVA